MHWLLQVPTWSVECNRGPARLALVRPVGRHGLSEETLPEHTPVVDKVGWLQPLLAHVQLEPSERIGVAVSNSLSRRTDENSQLCGHEFVIYPSPKQVKRTAHDSFVTG